MAGYLIHTPAAPSAFERERAAELGPAEVNSSTPIEAMTQSSGFEIVAQRDVTESFHRTCKAILEVRKRLERELRAEEGSEFYEEEQGKKLGTLTGIEEGLLRRSLIVALKPYRRSLGGSR